MIAEIIVLVYYHSFALVHLMMTCGLHERNGQKSQISMCVCVCVRGNGTKKQKKKKKKLHNELA